MTIFNGNIRWYLLVLFCVATSLLTLIFYPYLHNWNTLLIDAWLSAFFFTATVFGGIVFVKSYPTKVGILIYAVFIGIVSGFASWYLNKLFLKWWFNDDIDYLLWLKNSSTTRLLVSLLANTWLITLCAVSRKGSVLENQFKQIADATTLHREAELFKLRQQLQPHFLYNSLNSISALILIQPDKAQEMIGRLSDFLRNSVKREAREQIPIDEELEYIEAYLAIETVRFGDRLKVVYDKQYTDSAVIPPFLLQPIIENAIKFGLYGHIGEVVINMKIALQDAYLTITIENPFDRANRPPSGTGFGLEGIQRRLYLLYGRTDLLETAQEQQTFTTTLKIPQRNA
ncbi:MAG TPA: histidine kinase [Flavipsychrobacter sp.]|nr:histidine kinase [Flavipsychrobacter sp.]